ncbi:transcriptional repressor AgaR [Sphingomonas xinjiangensis]|uniref:DeoR family transcriptional regulator of aga operon n=1 Tax=Sphingomonas xinjiangensis TaxID=643568 RepID=A0A840YRY4_9SPHN|nr:transcriptional repressor AgaR [Sphingomonas xinjiangensis]MBB5712432.1 DeoR family transcriptional regulator of aga operon [Sphingomonas xinjiangensis]
MSVIRDTSERRQQISALVRERGSVQVAPLASRFGVSMQTIRKDLHYLEKRGVAERSYGGAISADAVNVVAEPPLETKRASNIDQKARIGALAASMVQPGDSIVLDSGTTTLQIAHHLPDDEDITVLTNDLDILCALARKERIRVVMLGGTLRRRNRAFYGAQTENALDDLHVDKLFLGVDGFDLERGITTHFEPEAMLNRRMVKAARQVIAVTDKSKFGRVCLHRILNVAEIDDLITDGDDADGMQAGAERAGFRLHIA